MARKIKKVKKTKKRAIRKTTAKRITTATKPQAKSLFRWGESYTSLLLGIIVVIIGILFVTSLIKTHHTQEVSSTSTVVTGTPEQQQTDQTEKTYTVQSGEGLWQVAEKFYHDGYKWVDIAKANHISDPYIIYQGDKLTLPSLNKPQQTDQLMPSTTPAPTNAITGNTYTVQKDDDLWNIAVRAYGDGYRWPDIAAANNLSDPGLIFSGNVIKIPR